MRVHVRIACALHLPLAAMMCAAAPPAMADEVARPEARLAVVYQSISEGTANRLADRIAAERAKVRAWWGATFEGEIRIDVRLRYRITRALVPAWRGKRGLMERPARFPLRRATLHELVHIYAPNANRFLAEGLAAYAQSRFETRPVHPNYGEDLDALAAKLRDQTGMAALDRVATPTILPHQGYLDSQQAYIVAGSFVGFLIDRNGLDRFRALYALSPLVVRNRDNAGDPARWARVYGKPLAALETGWQRSLDRLAAAPRRQPGADSNEVQD